MPLKTRAEPLPLGCEPACRGCSYRALSADESKSKKEFWVRSHFASARGLVVPERTLEYRRKIVLSAEAGSAEWRFGLYRREGRELKLVPIHDCPVHREGANRIFARVRKVVPTHWPLRFVVLTGGMLTLVLKTKPRSDLDLDVLCALEGLVDSCHVNWNPGAGTRVFGKSWLNIFGSFYGVDDGFVHGPSSFRQQIPEMENAAVDAAFEFLGATRVNSLVDFYSGVGVSLVRARSLGWRAMGVELHGESALAAEKNSGFSVLKGRVEDRLPQVSSFVGGNEFVLYTNPPRLGHVSRVNDWILSARPTRVAYLSCNVKNLKRDIDSLAGGYDLRAVQPFDFFPRTDHVETLALLEIKKN